MRSSPSPGASGVSACAAAVSGAQLLLGLLREGRIAGEHGLGANVAGGGGVDGSGQRQIDAGGFQAHARRQVGHGGSGGARRHVEVAVQGRGQRHARRLR